MKFALRPYKYPHISGLDIQTAYLKNMRFLPGGPYRNSIGSKQTRDTKPSPVRADRYHQKFRVLHVGQSTAGAVDRHTVEMENTPKVYRNLDSTGTIPTHGAFLNPIASVRPTIRQLRNITAVRTMNVIRF